MQPIDNIQWINADKIKANNYNPNHVFKQEMQLLALSIQQDGWLQPLLINKDYTLIDGYHRLTLLKTNPQISQKTNNKAPCIKLNLTPTQCKLMTIRINRAKGTHTAYKMSEVIHQLHHTDKLPIKTIAQQIGATTDEIKLLLQDNIFTYMKFDETSKYNQAWTPK
jgi:ParB-like chromosome segregation protein Spo0J